MKLFLVHGFMGGPESWRPVTEALAPDVESETFRVAGHGSAAPPAHSFVEEVDRLAATLAATDHDHVVGYSLGGRLVLGAAIRHPALWREGRIRRLTLIGAHPGISSPAARARRAEDDERWAQLLERAGVEVFLEEWRRQPVFAGLVERASPERLAEDERRRRSHGAAELAGALRSLSLARMPDWTPRLTELELPVELVVGDLDDKFHDLARAMVKRLPDARLSLVAGAGHNLLLEAPERVAQILAAAEGISAGDRIRAPRVGEER